MPVFFMCTVSPSLTCTFLTWQLISAGADLGILRGGGGFWAGILQRGGGGVRVQVRSNFHILTSKKKRPGGCLNPYPPPPLDPPCTAGTYFRTSRESYRKLAVILTYNTYDCMTLIINLKVLFGGNNCVKYSH